MKTNTKTTSRGNQEVLHDKIEALLNICEDACDMQPKEIKALLVEVEEAINAAGDGQLFRGREISLSESDMLEGFRLFLEPWA